MSQQAVTINSVVLLGISDQFTRKSIQKPKDQNRIVGGLMGKKIGGQIIINSAFELSYQLDKNGEILSIDQDHLEKKVSLIKTDDPYNHFRDDEFLGWYSTTADAQFCKQDIKIHNLINQSLNKLLAGAEGNESDKNEEQGLYLCITLDQKILTNPNCKEVPINLFKTQVIQDNTQFVQVQHVVNAEKGETISIESSSKGNTNIQSAFGEKLMTTLNAINRYNEKIEGLMQSLENPQIGQNLVLMRELKGILNSYPEQFQGKLDKQMMEQYSDANITSFLSGISSTNRLVQDVYQNNHLLKNATFNRNKFQQQQDWF